MQLDHTTLKACWTSGGGVVRRVPAKTHLACRTCGLALHGWQADVLDVKLCPLCLLPIALNRPAIEQEAVVVWLPEITQRALIPLVRAAQVTLRNAGLEAATRHAPARPISEAAHDAIAALAALRARGDDARQRLGSNSPRVLGGALLEIAETSGPAVLGGLRVLPLGTLFQDGVDIFPQILADWSASIEEA